MEFETSLSGPLLKLGILYYRFPGDDHAWLVLELELSLAFVPDRELKVW